MYFLWCSCGLTSEEKQEEKERGEERQRGAMRLRQAGVKAPGRSPWGWPGPSSKARVARAACVLSSVLFTVSPALYKVDLCDN